MGALTNQLLDLALQHDASLTQQEREALSYFRSHGAVKFTEVERGSLMLPAVRAAELLDISPELFLKVREWAAKTEVSEDEDYELAVALQGLRGVTFPTGTKMYSRQALRMFARGEIEVRLSKIGTGKTFECRRHAVSVEAAS